MIKNLIEQRKKLLADARALMTGDNITAETRTKADAMIADAEVLRGDIERIKATEIEEAQPEQRSRNTPPRGAVEASTEVDAPDERSFEQRNRASNVALRSFIAHERFERRDLTQAANGAVMIPTGAIAPVSTKKFAGAMYDIVNHLRTQSGEPILVPLADDTSNGFVLDSTTVAYASDPTLTGVTSNVDGLRSDPILIDYKLAQDVDFDLVSWVNAQIQSRYLRSLNKNIVQGNSSCFAALGGTVGLTTATAATIVYGELVKLMTLLDPAYNDNAVWSMNNGTLAYVLGLADANGRPIFIPFNDGGNSGFPGTILGYPVKIDPYAPDVAASATPIRFGDHAAAYTVREVTPGIVIKQSTDRWIETGKTGVVAFARAGGVSTIQATGPAPLLKLKCHA